VTFLHRQPKRSIHSQVWHRSDVDFSFRSHVFTATSTATIGPTKTAEAKSGSKAWIAGAVVGPILGLALIGAGVLFFLRRKKNKATHVPQHGTASMAPIDPSQPPAGVGTYTDAKPQPQTSQPSYYNETGQPDPYAQQGYPQQGGYSPAPQMSPAPQYGSQPPYSAPASPPPPGIYTNDVKHGYSGGAAELGGETSELTPAAPVSPGSPPAHPAPTTQAAELGGGDMSHTEGLPGSAELPANTYNKSQ
jgi:LPXTG-motif cell wall-anchored protein